MTEAAEKSKWIKKEIHIALENEKTVIGIWLEGRLFRTLIDVQCEDMRGKEKNGKMLLPGSDFYQQLEMYLPKKTQPWNTRQSYIAVPVELSSELYEELSRWEKFSAEGATDFYGIVMLALAYEALSTFRAHKEAIKFLKRAYSLEPRILFPK